MKSMNLRFWFNRHLPMLEILMTVIFAGLVVRTFVFTQFVVTQKHMSPLLEPGDFVFVYRLPFGFQIPLLNQKTGGVIPKTGDVMLFDPELGTKQFTIARFLGGPGDKIQLLSAGSVNELQVNGNLIQGDWIQHVQWKQPVDFTVPQNKYAFVNYQGLTHVIGYEALVGQVKLLWFSKADQVRWDRFPRLIN